MTRKEAKEFIAQSVKSDIDMALVADAIKALEQQTCEDAVSRAEAIKAMNDLEQEDIEQYGCHIPEGFDGKRAIEALQSLPSVALSAEPCGDAISREMALKECHDIVIDGERYSVIQEETFLELPPVNPQPKTGQFAKWVATEIFDDNWEYNKDAFAELACRKLAKIGIVRAKGDKWELVEPQERNDKE